MRISDIQPKVTPQILAPQARATDKRCFYLVHIRKTAGTSLNHMFLSLGDPDHESFHKALADKPDHILDRNGKRFVGWDEGSLNRGGYFYGFSHSPLYRLQLPSDAFVFTVFRDPVKRVISHYNMLMGLHFHAIPHPCMLEEGPWIADGFEGFLDRIPREHLLNQLHMFSPRLDPKDAMDRLKKLDLFFFTEKFEVGVDTLNRMTGLQLKPLRERVSQHKSLIARPLLEKLRSLLEPEYQFLSEAKKCLKEPGLAPEWLA